jgi:hypothetical protein
VPPDGLGVPSGALDHVTVLQPPGHHGLARRRPTPAEAP